MKKISIRELHRRTGAWVRSAKRHGSVIVTDRNTPIAKLTPILPDEPVNRFATWKPLKKFAKILDRPVGGRPAEEIISEDRDR